VRRLPGERIEHVTGLRRPHILFLAIKTFTRAALAPTPLAAVDGRSQSHSAASRLMMADIDDCRSMDMSSHHQEQSDGVCSESFSYR
jgi:hypothetical protein